MLTSVKEPLTAINTKQNKNKNKNKTSRLSFSLKFDKPTILTRPDVKHGEQCGNGLTFDKPTFLFGGMVASLDANPESFTQCSLFLSQPDHPATRSKVYQ